MYYHILYIPGARWRAHTTAGRCPFRGPGRRPRWRPRSPGRGAGAGCRCAACAARGRRAGPRTA